MTRLNIKPLSVNTAFTGVRFKTDEYKSYAKLVLLSLKPMKIPNGKLEISYKFGLSNSGADLDNCVKQFQDLLCAKYNFNDNKIYRIMAEKEIVPKGQEFIEFEIKSYDTQL